MTSRRELLLLSALGLAGACAAPRRSSLLASRLPEIPPPVGDSIIVCGRRFRIDAPVVLWSDPAGYNAYSTEVAFPAQAPAEPPQGLRFAPGRQRADGRAVTLSQGLDAVREVVDQFVVHYDVAGTSRTCFQVLHDRRRLSVHFLLDIDGTIYQTLDLAETAWHARQANSRSVGVELAHIGAYAPGETGPIDEWYVVDEHGPRLAIPARLGDGGVRMQGFVGRPIRPQMVRGTVQGRELLQYDFTPEQLHSLACLAAGVTRAFPLIAIDVPRYAAGPRRGEVRSEVLSDQEFRAFRGILGHYHISADKVDPGPAFDWEAFLRRLRARRALPLASLVAPRALGWA